MSFHYLDPIRGRVGPVSMEELLRLYRAGAVHLETPIFVDNNETPIPFALIWNSQPRPPGNEDGPHPFFSDTPPPLPKAEHERSESFTGRAGRDIRHMLPHLLLPLDEFRKFDWIENRRITTLASVGLLPLVIYALFGQPGQLGTAFWAMALYFSALWALFFFYVFPTPEVRVGVSVFCFFVTSVASVSILLILYSYWPLSAVFVWIKSEYWLVRWLGFVFGVGIPEELCKALVLFVILRRLGPFRPQTVLFYGLISGLGFGIYEGVKYQTQHNFDFAIRTAGQDDQYFAAEYYLLNLIRLTTLPFLHAIWTGIAGYFLGFAAQYPDRRGGLLVVAIGLPAFLHGSYNAFSSTLGIPIALVSILALNLYLAKSVEFSNLLNERRTRG